MRIKKYGMRLDENKHPVLVKENVTNYVTEEYEHSQRYRQDV